MAWAAVQGVHVQADPRKHLVHVEPADRIMQIEHINKRNEKRRRTHNRTINIEQRHHIQYNKPYKPPQHRLDFPHILHLIKIQSLSISHLRIQHRQIKHPILEQLIDDQIKLIVEHVVPLQRLSIDNDGVVIELVLLADFVGEVRQAVGLGEDYAGRGGPRHVLVDVAGGAIGDVVFFVGVVEGGLVLEEDGDEGVS
jgi:hypothetical protein